MLFIFCSYGYTGEMQLSTDAYQPEPYIQMYYCYKLINNYGIIFLYTWLVIIII